MPVNIDNTTAGNLTFKAPSSGTTTIGFPSGNGTSGQYLQTDGSGNTTWANAGAGGGLLWQSVQTANFSATTGNGYPIDTTSAAITVTLSATPSQGDTVAIVDYAGTWSTNNVTVNPNGKNINNSALNVILTGIRESIVLVYLDATQGWIAQSGFIRGPITPYSGNYLLVAGGGGGGAGTATITGGGGASGGYRSGSITYVPGTTYTVNVGSGGASSTNGSNSTIVSSISTITSVGGGLGGYIATAGGSGGSGGGSSGQTANGAGSGTSGQGNNGGAGSTGSTVYGAGGGGGAGAVGSAGSATFAGNGGAGSSSTILGSTTYYAGGGGGGGVGSPVGYVTAPSNAAFTFGTGDFTIEMWIHPLSTPVANFYFYGWRSGSDTSPQLYWNNVTGLTFGGDTTNMVLGGVPSINVWTHIAVCRTGTSLKFFVNGNLANTSTNSNNFSFAHSPYIGAINIGSYNFNGLISNVRVVKGVGVYTGPFTVPNTPLSATQSSGTNILAISGTATSLLTCQSATVVDNSTNAFTLTSSSGVTVVTNYPPLFQSSSYSIKTGVFGGGGQGGGGNGGAALSTSGEPGLANTGGGGGGAGNDVVAAGATGGSGVGILSVPLVNYTYLTTGSPTVTVNGANIVLTFNSSGSYTA
ncbi:Concanavalin A-like lectin/glucanases superfamily [uncultured Caudovirales phage]|uniref:Concanavalin A-like lectin/glucanases superfamily n=1 Tax=uncultured Caudovirales phage TaxID=2100421 RepID=A0A6J5L2W1_9CAUD|nr:Concanavalin A-like lectin/glucanases superfamily [uncultured Caudovirales phage]